MLQAVYKVVFPPCLNSVTITLKTTGLSAWPGTKDWKHHCTLLRFAVNIILSHFLPWQANSLVESCKHAGIGARSIHPNLNQEESPSFPWQTPCAHRFALSFHIYVPPLESPGLVQASTG